MPLRPILKKDLTIRSTETGKISDIEAALCLAASQTVTSRIELTDFYNLNHALDRLKSGTVMGKLVLDMQHMHRSLPMRDATRL